MKSSILTEMRNEGIGSIVWIIITNIGGKECVLEAQMIQLR